MTIIAAALGLTGAATALVHGSPICTWPWPDDGLVPRETCPALRTDAAALAALCQRCAPLAPAAESEHFVVLCSTPPAAARLTAVAEAVYWAHARLAAEFRVPSQPPRHKLEVCLFSRREDMLACAEVKDLSPEILGFYHPEQWRCMFTELDAHPEVTALRAELAKADPATRARLEERLARRLRGLELTILQHELAHEIEVRTGWYATDSSAPIWLVEGLAMLFETPFGPTGQAQRPANSYRLHEFRKLYGADIVAPADLLRFMTDDDAWHADPRSPYPLAYALTQYLRTHHAAGFGQLLRDAAGERLPPGPDARRAYLETLFGRLDAAWVTGFHTATLALDGPSAAGDE